MMHHAEHGVLSGCIDEANNLVEGIQQQTSSSVVPLGEDSHLLSRHSLPSESHYQNTEGGNKILTRIGRSEGRLE